MRKVFSLASVGLLAALLTLSACGGATPAAPTAPPTQGVAAATATTAAAAAGEPIRVGLYQGLTGGLAFIGQGYKLGVQLAVADLGGAIEGHPIELYEADTKCNPTDTVNAVRRLIDVDEVDVLIGGGCSGATLAALPIIAEGETPALDGSSTNPAIYNQLGVGGNPWQFRIAPDDLIMGRGFAQYIADQGVGALSFVADDNAFGRGAGRVYVDVFADIGVNVVSEDYFDPATSDFRPALTRIRAAGADAILIVMTEQSCATLMRQFRETGLDLPVYSRGACTSGVFNDLTKDDPSIGEGIVEFTFFNQGQDPQFDQRFLEFHNQPPSGHRMAGYYIMYYTIAPAIQNLIQSGQEPTRENIRAAIAALDIQTPAGRINFDDHNQAYTDGTLSVNRNGDAVLLDTVPLEPVDHTGYD